MAFNISSAIVGPILYMARGL